MFLNTMNYKPKNVKVEEVEEQPKVEKKSYKDYLPQKPTVEAHDEDEANMAVKCGARIIGVNNRDLKTFTVDPTNCLRLRKIIPEKIRIPAFIVIIASFVTIVELLLNAYIPSLYLLIKFCYFMTIL